MIADKFIELMHQEIDGANSPKESAKLQAFLASNPEARKLYEELASMSSLLQEVKPVEPPAYLPHVIMNRLPTNRYASRPAANWVAGFREWLATNFSPKSAFAFAGGAIMGIVMYALLVQTTLQSPAEDWSKLSGAMIQRETVENLKTVQTLEINGQNVAGKIDLKNTENLVAAELALDSSQPIEVTISFDEKQLGLKSLTMLDESAASEAIIISGAAQLTHAGSRRYAIILTKKAPAVRLEFKIAGAGEVLYEKSAVISP
ncbi:MAG: hypothetical protein ONB46_02305 [candidate division KSB1 bacterium]|nr:hypothetical protein [candidate division KSB1 bacterium]MDZ7364499.1 hypothetical protein [candidate division KSB1 bacterium]MDZ7402870.1 hypothetical protein [candidate division KSB1 bacterium]